MKKMTLRTLPVLMLAAFSGAASASAFQLWEQNASGLGTAYAGSAAVADNASTVFFNPAGMTQLNGMQVSVGVSGVGPSFEFNNEGSSGRLGGGGNGGNAGGWLLYQMLISPGSFHRPGISVLAFRHRLVCPPNTRIATGLVPIRRSSLKSRRLTTTRPLHIS